MNSRWKNWIQENEDNNADRIEMLEKMVLGEFPIKDAIKHLNLDKPDYITEHWKKWIRENLELGASKLDMVRVLIDNKMDKYAAINAVILNPQSNYEINQVDEESESESESESNVNNDNSSNSGENNDPTVFTKQTDFDYGKVSKNLLDSSPQVLGNDNGTVYVVDNFFTKEECQQLIDSSKPNLRQSVLCSDDNSDSYADTLQRVSESCILEKFNDFNHLEQRISDLVGIKLDNSESTQVQYYKKDGFFNTHTDSFSKQEYKKYGNKNGQRTWTAMVYLNDVEKGGHTHFSKLNVSVRPEQGRVVVWNNLNSDGSNNNNLQHEGRKVLEGEKYIVTKWFRDRKQVE